MWSTFYERNSNIAKTYPLETIKDVNVKRQLQALQQNGLLEDKDKQVCEHSSTDPQELKYWGILNINITHSCFLYPQRVSC